MKWLNKTVIYSLVISTGISAAALEYDKEKGDAMRNITAVESASITRQYNCGNFTLFLESFASASDAAGNKASVSGRLVAGEKNFDLSGDLDGLITRDQVIAGHYAVGCNAQKGVFKIYISPNSYAATQSDRLGISVFWDGTVRAFRAYVPE